MADVFEKMDKYSSIIFDYDNTIARIPIDWKAARIEFRSYLKKEFPALEIKEGLRIDEMEYLAMSTFADSADKIYAYRSVLEKQYDHQHIPISKTIEFIRDFDRNAIQLFVVSNNLKETVVSGLQDIKLLHVFTEIVGVDTTKYPKPYIQSAEYLKNKYDINFETTAMVGDSIETDGKYSERLGMAFINIYID